MPVAAVGAGEEQENVKVQTMEDKDGPTPAVTGKRLTSKRAHAPADDDDAEMNEREEEEAEEEEEEAEEEKEVLPDPVFMRTLDVQ